MIILIPPSEGKASGGTKPPLKTLHPITKELISKIQTAEPAKLYGLKDKGLAEAVATNKTILSSKTLPAIERYTGVVYDGIDYPTLKHKKRFDKEVRIVSGLFGLVAPQDTIPNYRLKIDKLQAAQRWKEELVIDDFVIDLLPKAHKKAVQYENGIAVEFVIEKKGKRIPAGHNGKFIKGRFVRWLIENGIHSPEEFSQFNEDGFKWNGKEFIKKIKG